MRGNTRLANDAWEALLRAHATLMKQFAAEDIWTEVSMREYDVLYTLSKCREPIRLGELHRQVLLSQPALSRMVDRLAARGLVRRAADPGDGRGVLLSLTEAGRAQQREVGRRHARSVATAMTRSLTTDELAQLGSLCAQLARRQPLPATLTNPGGRRAMTTQPPFALVVVSAGTSDPSTTRLLADRTAARVAAIAADRDRAVTTTVIDLRELATEITSAITSRLIGARLAKAVAALGAADGIIASTPVYKAGASGLFTSFFQILDDDLLIAKPVILGATAGTARHALAVDEQVRGLFAYLRALPVPTSLFAASEDWNDPALAERIDRAACELVLLMDSGFARQVKESSWHSYQHEFGSGGGTEYGIDLDSDLMKLAAGGSLDG